MAKKEKEKSPEDLAFENELGDDIGEDPLRDYDAYVQAQAAKIWHYQDTGHDLTLEEQLFCRSYIIDRNPVAALNRLGYSASPPVLKQRAKKMLANPEVSGCIEVLAQTMMERLEITADRIQQKMAAVAFFDPREVMEFDKYGVRVINSRFWTENQVAAISGLKNGQYGLELKFYDRQKALEALAKQVGLQPDDFDEAAKAEAMAESAMRKIAQFFDRSFSPEVKRVPPPVTIDVEPK